VLTIGLDAIGLHPPHGAYVEHLLLADPGVRLSPGEAPVPHRGDAGDRLDRRQRAHRPEAEGVCSGNDGRCGGGRVSCRSLAIIRDSSAGVSFLQDVQPVLRPDFAEHGHRYS
jgi:hypothetical protein